MDTKGTLELLNAIEILAVAGKKIAKDGIGMADIPEAVELLKHIDEIMMAIKDFHLIGEEIKDVDQAELIILGSKVFSMVKAIKEA